jgi:hypothetical protein
VGVVPILSNPDRGPEQFVTPVSAFLSSVANHANRGLLACNGYRPLSKTPHYRSFLLRGFVFGLSSGKEK